MVVRLLAILLLIVMFSATSHGDGNSVPQEYEVKAKYLLNIPLFIEMPEQRKIDASYNICLIGDTPLENILKTSNVKMILNRPVAIRKEENLRQGGSSCQMLFIASSEHHHLQPLLAEAHLQGILTISDMRDFARKGGIVGLQIVNNRITFDLNRHAASKASISFSSHLLKLAHDIIN